MWINLREAGFTFDAATVTELGPVTGSAYRSFADSMEVRVWFERYASEDAALATVDTSYGTFLIVTGDRLRRLPYIFGFTGPQEGLIMSSFNRSSKGTPSVLGIAALLVTVSAVTALAQDASVVYLEGEPELRTSGGTTEWLDFGTTMAAGDSVVTGRNDFVELEQGEAATIQVGTGHRLYDQRGRARRPAGTGDEYQRRFCRVPFQPPHRT